MGHPSSTRRDLLAAASASGAAAFLTPRLLSALSDGPPTTPALAVADPGAQLIHLLAEDLGLLARTPIRGLRRIFAASRASAHGWRTRGGADELFRTDPDGGVTSLPLGTRLRDVVCTPSGGALCLGLDGEVIEVEESLTGARAVLRLPGAERLLALDPTRSVYLALAPGRLATVRTGRAPGILSLRSVRGRPVDAVVEGGAAFVVVEDAEECEVGVFDPGLGRRLQALRFEGVAGPIARRTPGEVWMVLERPSRLLRMNVSGQYRIGEERWLAPATRGLATRGSTLFVARTGAVLAHSLAAVPPLEVRAATALPRPIRSQGGFSRVCDLLAVRGG